MDNQYLSDEELMNLASSKSKNTREDKKVNSVTSKITDYMGV